MKYTLKQNSIIKLLDCVFTTGSRGNHKGIKVTVTSISKLKALKDEDGHWTKVTFSKMGLNRLYWAQYKEESLPKLPLEYFPRHMHTMMTSSNGNISASPVNSRHKGQWCGAFMFSLICAWINGWVNNLQAGDLKRHWAHYDATVMSFALRSVDCRFI